MSETAETWALKWWKAKHDRGYFPNSKQHRNWKVYDEAPDWLVDRVKPDSTVLEIGCGYGEWLIPLMRQCRPAQAFGVDIHPAPIEKGIQFCTERGLRNVCLTLNDGLSLPFEDAAFDVVYSISVFQHLPRSIVAGYMKESDRVLKPGGLALHHFRNADNVGPYPPLATDIAACHAGDFSVGWTASEVYDAGRAAGWSCDVIDLGLFLVLAGRNP